MELDISYDKTITYNDDLSSLWKWSLLIDMLMYLEYNELDIVSRWSIKYNNLNKRPHNYQML